MNLIIKKSAILLLLVFSVISFIGSQSGTALFANYSVATGGNNFEEKKEEVNDRGFHVNELTAYCTDKGIGGKVIFENDSDDEITKKVKLFLTYHTPGASIWLPSGNYTEVEATVGAGKSTVKEYTMTISNVPFYANSIRVENKWDTTKSESFKPCKTEEVPTITPTASVTPSVSPTGTPTETPTITPTLSPTVTPSVSPIPTLTPTVTPTATPTPTVTSTPIPSQSVTPSLTLTPTVTPTQTPTVAPTNSPAPTITVTPTVTPTAGPEGPLSRCYDLEAIPSEGSAPLTVKFTGHADDPVSGGKIKEYRFDFGDASDGQPQVWAQPGREAYHRYTLAGEYEASLRVQDNAGNWRESDDCKTNIKVTSTPQVLGVKTPEELPQTGASVLLSGIGLMSLAFAGRYIYRRFKLV